MFLASSMELIDRYFLKRGYTLCERLSRLVLSLLDSFSASTGDISRSMAKLFSTSFKAAEMYAFRALSDHEFQVDDGLWRCHVNLIFNFLIEKNALKKGGMLCINVDYTTIRDDFLILMASITVNGEKGIMCYFSMRNYPKKKGRLSLIKMEEAFLRELKHILPKGYEYAIIGDRGFGNDRIVSLCEKLGFNYVLRITESLNIELDGKTLKLASFKEKNALFEATVKKWKKKIKFCINTNKKNLESNTWYIMTNLKVGNIAEIYANRFKIEKLFQDLKSSGFNIENSKIKKYDKMKRLLFCIGLAHAISTFVGFFLLKLKEELPNNYYAITVYSKLGKLC
jgi:hypothetical protein